MSVCENCIWRDQCRTLTDCPDYTPADEDVDQLIDEGKYEFRRAWRSYMKPDMEKPKLFF